MNTISPAPTVRPMPVAPKARSIAAQGNALGSGDPTRQAMKGRPNGGLWRIRCAQGWAALSGLPAVSWAIPRALPWATIGCPFAAEERNATRVDGHLRTIEKGKLKMENAR
jgi:hypothetical protein